MRTHSTRTHRNKNYGDIVIRNMRSVAVKQRGTAVLATALCVLAAACGRDGLRSLFVGYTPHERYQHSLREAGLDETALGRDWIAAAEEALNKAVPLEAPYREESYLDPREASASGYRIGLRRGQRLSAQFESEPDSSYRVFFDVFVIPTGSTGTPRLLASADSLERELDFVARRDGDYLLRIQPELLRGGRYSITIVVGPSLAFPVDGHDTRAIRSWFGDPRDGGRRNHDGVDIFAPRGTPVIAAGNGRVRSTRRNRLGGKVVWITDELGRSLYYAHLDSQVVARGDPVRVGDTVGFVGNTGNARTTPPHLHFGIYERGFGPSDPYPALYEPPSTPAVFAGNPELIGELGRVSRDRVRVRALPTSRAPAIMELSRHTPVRVAAGTGSWYRIALPDGAIGYVAAQLTELADSPIRSELVANGAILRTQPELSALALDSLSPGAEVPVLGSFGEFLYVQAPSGRAGWLALN